MKHFEIVNWGRFQHYKNRRPPWIKLYTDIFADYRFSLLPDNSKLDLILIWTLAAKLDNHIPYDAKWLQAQIGVTHKVNLKILVESGFVHIIGSKTNDLDDASITLSDCKQLATPETETNTETNTETETDSKLSTRASKFITKQQMREEMILEFDQDRGFYPPRGGTHDIARARVKYIALRIELGGKFSREDIAFSFQRYYRYCESLGRIKTQYVKKLSTFLDDENIENTWEVDTNDKQTTNPSSRLNERSKTAREKIYAPTDTTD